MIKKKLSVVLALVCLIQLFCVYGVWGQEVPNVENASRLHSPTVKNMLANACLPIGKTVYVYGGGWNKADTAAGEEAMAYGVSPQWEEFYNKQKPSYDYNTTRYQIHNGLDCTGYVGWTMYQIFGDVYSDNGYVYLASEMALAYSKIFDGKYTAKENVTERQSGDIMSSKGHAYIVVGQCKDGSVVFLHASPPAVSLCGTYTPEGKKDSQAVKLAKYYMETYFPAHYQKYPSISRDGKYLTDYNRMQWSENVLADPDGYRNMWAEDILADLFGNVKIYAKGERVMSEAEPYIHEGTTYVPLRAVSESFDADVTWDAETSTATVETEEHVLVINTAEKTVEFDGEEDDRLFEVVNDRITVPIRLVAQLCGFSVEWEEVSKSVYLEK